MQTKHIGVLRHVNLTNSRTYVSRIRYTDGERVTENALYLYRDEKTTHTRDGNLVLTSRRA